VFFLYLCAFIVFYVISVLYVFLEYFDTVGWVFRPVKTVDRISYTVLAVP